MHKVNISLDLVALYRSFVFGAIFISVSASCARVKDPVSQDQLALELLNAGRYSDAAIVLETQIKEQPQNDQARLRLASAYAGEVGFNLVDAFAAFEPLIAFNPKDSRAQEVRLEPISGGVTDDHATDATSSDEPTVDQREKIKRFERNLLVTILDSEMATRVLFSLPYLSEGGRSKISRSIVILRDIPAGSSSYRMGLFYESVIQFLLFSNYMRDSLAGVALGEEQATYSLKIYCGLDLQVFLQKLPFTMAHLRSGIEALNVAGSDNQGRFFQNVRKALRAIESLHQSYLQNGNLFTLAEIGDRRVKESVCD